MRTIVGVVLPFATLAASIAVAVFSFSRMDGARACAYRPHHDADRPAREPALPAAPRTVEDQLAFCRAALESEPIQAAGGGWYHALWTRRR